MKKFLENLLGITILSILLFLVLPFIYKCVASVQGSFLIVPSIISLALILIIGFGISLVLEI